MVDILWIFTNIWKFVNDMQCWQLDFLHGGGKGSPEKTSILWYFPEKNDQMLWKENNCSYQDLPAWYWYCTSLPKTQHCPCFKLLMSPPIPSLILNYLPTNLSLFLIIKYMVSLRAFMTSLKRLLKSKSLNIWRVSRRKYLNRHKNLYLPSTVPVFPILHLKVFSFWII